MAETFENEWTKRIEELEAELKAERERADALEKDNKDLNDTVDSYAIICRGHSGTLTGIHNLRLRAENAEKEVAHLTQELAEARRVICDAAQSLNESGIGEMGLINTIHRTHRILVSLVGFQKWASEQAEALTRKEADNVHR